jgi:hypothetical protein
MGNFSFWQLGGKRSLFVQESRTKRRTIIATGLVKRAEQAGAQDRVEISHFLNSPRDIIAKNYSNIMSLIYDNNHHNNKELHSIGYYRTPGQFRDNAPYLRAIGGPRSPETQL